MSFAKRSRSFAAASYVLLALFAACGKPHVKSTPETRGVVGAAPKWYTTPPRADDIFFGVATAESKDMQLAAEKAQMAARAQIAQQMTVKLGAFAKRFQEEVGQGASAELLDQFTTASKAVVSEELVGSRVKEQELVPGEDVYRAFVLMELPVGAANKALRDKLAAQQALYTRFRATQAFKEMNDEIEKYEKAKAADRPTP
ncbi:MAG: LPP20 family lipoprotein [Gemmatimonadetes bacterium]|nr:LPP20 family lipoprotein [Gemmatimonadota bacterium]